MAIIFFIIRGEEVDASRFTESKTGELVRIKAPYGDDWAFIPNPLPPAWDLPLHLWPLLAEARELLARLDEKGATLKNPSLLMTPLRKREALRSSSLEGTFATAQELLLFELNPREPVSTADKANSWREVYNYDKALKYGCGKLREPGTSGLPLSLRLIAEIHGLLLKDVRGNAKRAGEFRDHQVHVGSDRRYVPPPPGPMMEALKSLEKFVHLEEQRYDPLVLSYLVHYQFEAIHPFLDGNGRIGRALLSMTVFEWKRLRLPWLYMSAYFERYKVEYIDNLFRVSTHGDWDRWIEFCLRGTIEQCIDSIRRCDLLNSLRSRMRRELGKLPRMSVIIDELFYSPVFSVSNVMAWGSSSRPTAVADVRKLIESKFVKHLSGERPRKYFAPEIFSIAYSEDHELRAPARETPNIQEDLRK